MRLCRYRRAGAEGLGVYHDDVIVPLDGAAGLGETRDILALAMSPDAHARAKAFEPAASAAIATADIELLAPIAAPGKILLLAGNYAAHIEEEGKIALERAETFPYLFMKPNTTVNHPNAPVVIPKVSPDHIDYECELAIVMGKRARGVSEAEALDYVAGYTVLNDISDRKYTPFPERKPRDRDAFFDWLHGKWHDGFCPMGPCLRTARTMPDPQRQRVTLSVNGEIRQDGSTAQMIFPVAAIIEFVSRAITLEPGDVIATGTPAGIGMTTGRYLKPGDVVEASVEGIGALRNVMAAEA